MKAPARTQPPGAWPNLSRRSSVAEDTAADNGTKRCPRCKETKPLSAFSRCSRTKDGLQCYCKECQRILGKEWRSSPGVREATNAYRRKWLTPEKNREYHQRYNEKHPGYAARKTQKWRADNPEKLAEQRAKMPEYGREWRARNPDKVLDWTHKRRALKAKTASVPVNRSEVAERDNWRCHICGQKVTRKNWSLDHLVPLSRGGTHTMDNVALAHLRCNLRRGRGSLPAQLLLLG